MVKNPQEKAPANVESEIERLKAQLAEKEKMLGEQKEVKPKTEITKKEEKSKPEEIAEAKKEIKAETQKEEKVPTALSESMNDPEILKELKGVIESGASPQVVQLAYRAFEKGVPYAMEIARKMNDPSALAEFRGILVGELHEKLKEKKKL